jgi:hypothetical protein
LLLLLLLLLQVVPILLLLLFRCWVVLIPDDIEGDKEENPWDVLRDNNIIVIIVMDSIISLFTGKVE